MGIFNIYTIGSERLRRYWIPILYWLHVVLLLKEMSRSIHFHDNIVCRVGFLRVIDHFIQTSQFSFLLTATDTWQRECYARFRDCSFWSFQEVCESQLTGPSCIPYASPARLNIGRNPIMEIRSNGLKMFVFLCTWSQFAHLAPLLATC